MPWSAGRGIFHGDEKALQEYIGHPPIVRFIILERMQKLAVSHWPLHGEHWFPRIPTSPCIPLHGYCRNQSWLRY